MADYETAMVVEDVEEEEEEEEDDDDDDDEEEEEEYDDDEEEEEKFLLSTVLGSEGCYGFYLSVFEFMKDLEEAELKSWARGDGWVFWRTVSDVWQHRLQFYYDEGMLGIQPKIIKVFQKLATEGFVNLGFLMQLWAPGQTVVGRRCLSTSGLPFALIGLEFLTKGLCWYRKLSRGHLYSIMDSEEDEVINMGPIGRVFRTGLPEITPDLRLYSNAEHPLGDQSALCGIRPYVALPLFDRTTQLHCLGVLEIVFADFQGWELIILEIVEYALEVAGLRYTCIERDKLYQNPKYEGDPPQEIRELLELAIEEVPELQLAIAWANCEQSTTCASYMRQAACITSHNTKINLCGDLSDNSHQFLRVVALHNVQNGKGVVGRLLSSRVKACLFMNVCDFSIFEYPAVHYAQRAGLSLCFAICLRRKQNVNNLFVLEFFIQEFLSREEVRPLSIVRVLLRIMETKLRSFEVASGKQLGEKVEVEILAKNMSNGSFHLGGNKKPSLLGYNATQFIGQEKEHQQENDLSLPTELKDCFYEYDIDGFKELLQEPQLKTSQIGKGRYLFEPDIPREFLSYQPCGNINSSIFPNQIKEKILLLLREITETLDNSYLIVQYWARHDAGTCLTTSGQPFAVTSLHKGLCRYRKRCTSHGYIYGEEAKEEIIGPIGRVFRNGYPEFTPDLRLYSTREFLLRQDAVSNSLRRYAAFPVFDLHKQFCVGVLEVVTSSSYISLDSIQTAFENVALRSTHINCPSQPGPLSAEEEIAVMLHVAENIPHICGALVWVSPIECPSPTTSLTCMELKDTADHPKLPLFLKVICKVQKGKGVVGRALESKNKSCCCLNSCDLSITENPMVHYTVKERLGICFAICLKSSYTAYKLYAIEFHLNQGPTGWDYFCSFLKLLLPVMKQTLKSFKVASGKQLGEELVIDVIGFSGNKGFPPPNFNPSDKFPFRFETVQYGEGTEPQRLVGADQLQDYRATNGMSTSATTVHIAHTEESNTTLNISGDVNSTTNIAEIEENNIYTTTEEGNAKELMKIVMRSNISDKELEKQSGNPGGIAMGCLGEMKPQHIGDQQAHSTINGMNFATRVSETGENHITTIMERVDVEKIEKRKRGRPKREITEEQLLELEGKTCKEAADCLDVSTRTLYRRRNDHKISSKPPNEVDKNHSVRPKKSKPSEPIVQVAENISTSSSATSHKPSDLSPPQIVGLQPINSSTSKVPGMPDNDIVMVTATFEVIKSKFRFNVSSRLEKLKEKIVAKHSSIMHGSFRLEYFDGKRWISLADDEDLDLCVETHKSSGNDSIEIRVLLI